MERLSHFGVGKRDLTQPNHWKELSIKDIDIKNSDKPAVLFFGGDGAIEPIDANYNAKFIYSLIGSEGYDLYSFYYGIDDKEHDRGYFTIAEKEQIFDNIFKPLLATGDIKEVSKNLNKLKVVAYCYGNKEFGELCKMSDKYLQGRGFSKDESKQALASIFTVSYTPFGNIPYGSGVSFYSGKDNLIRMPTEFLIEDANGFYKPRDIDFAEIIKNAENKNILMIGTNAFSYLSYFSRNANDHLLEAFIRTNNPERGSIGTIEKKDFVLGNNRGDMLSEMFASAFSLGLLNTDIQNIEVVMQTYINAAKKIFPEKQIKVLDEEHKNGGRPFLKVLKENGWTEQDVLNTRKINGLTLNEIIEREDENFSIPISGINFKDSEIGELVEMAKYVSFLKIYYNNRYKKLDDEESVFEDWISSDGANMPIVHRSRIERDMLRGKIGGINFDDSLFVKITVSADKKQIDKNIIEVQSGKTFEKRKYSSVDDLRAGIIDSIKPDRNYELSSGQTWYILKNAQDGKVPFSNIILPPNMSLNKKILESFDYNEKEIPQEKSIASSKGSEKSFI